MMYKKASGAEIKSRKSGGSRTQKTIMACFLFCCVIIFSATMASAASQSVIPDTGQTLCYDSSGLEITCPAQDEALAQDGSYNFLYNQLTYSTSPGEIIDGITTLHWQVDDGFTYNWYEATGTVDETYNPDPGHLDVCGSLGAGWHLPTIKELNQIVHYGLSDPAIDGTFLLTGYDYWSATESALVPSNAMNVHFDSVANRIDGRDKGSEANYVMCVFGGELASSFVDRGTTVSDENSGLMWQQTDINSQDTWEEAITYCEDLSLQSYTDWRLPNIKELQTIVDYTTSSPAADTTFFPGTNSAFFWSSTNDDAFSDSAWAVDFTDGSVASKVKTLGTLYTRCVRENAVDSTPPDAVIDSGPGQPTAYSKNASFSFHAVNTDTLETEAEATFKCRIDSTDDADYVTCSSPKNYTNLSADIHTFDVKATDAVGNEGSATTYSWTINLDPDLTITALTVPSSGGAGASINVTDTTKNLGANPAGTFKTNFYLSTTGTLDGSEVLLGSRTIVSLGAGSVNTATTALTIPAVGTTDGTNYIIAVADGDDELAETDETNNAPLAREILIGPDLTVTSVSGVVSMPDGTITITDTTHNSGSAIGTPFVTNFYLSANTVLDAGDTLIGGRTITSLAGTADDSADTVLDVPAGKAGAFYIIAKADDTTQVTETNEGNNTKVSALIKIGGDLTVTELTVPTTGTPGGTISITYTTKNGTSGTPVNLSQTRFWLSKDATLNQATDYPLGTRDVPALTTTAPGNSFREVGVSFTLPAEAGSYYVIAKADVPNDNVETNETNNIKVSTVIKIGGDLTVSALTVPPTATPDTDIEVTDTTKNAAGGSAVGDSKTSFYLSKDTVLKTSGAVGVDTFLGYRVVTGPLAAGASSALVKTTLHLPADKIGTFYIIAKADGPEDAAGTNDNVVIEMNESNNAKVSAVIKIGGDLAVSALTVPVTAAKPGDSIDVTDTTRNNTGVADVTTTSTTGFYLSKNQTVDGSDTLLNSRIVPALAAGAFSTATTALVIPADTLAGSYYIIARADAGEVITETKEGNNAKVSALISIGGDLQISSISVPATASAGQGISVSYTVANIGNDTVAASKTRFYLSPTATLDTGDPATVFLGARDVPSLGAGVSTVPPLTTSLTIPTGTLGAPYYIIAKADGANAIAEVKENNNTKYGFIRIGGDLVVSALTAPATAAPNAGITVSDTTKNSGVERVVGQSTTQYYLSTKTVLDGVTEVPLGSRIVPGLAPGASSVGAAVSVTIPSDATLGTHYIIAEADYGNVKSEANEKNNTRYKAITIQ